MLAVVSATSPWHPFPSRARRNGSPSRAGRSVMSVIGLAVVVLVLAANPALLFRANLRRYRPPPPAPSQGKDGTVPALSVLIPARNEETTIAAALDRSSRAFQLHGI